MLTASLAKQGGDADNVPVRKLSGLAALSSSDVAALTHVSAQTSQVQARIDLESQGEAPTGAVLLPGDLCDLDGASLGHQCLGVIEGDHRL